MTTTKMTIEKRWSQCWYWLKSDGTSVTEENRRDNILDLNSKSYSNFSFWLDFDSKFRHHEGRKWDHRDRTRHWQALKAPYKAYQGCVLHQQYKTTIIKNLLKCTNYTISLENTQKLLTNTRLSHNSKCIQRTFQVLYTDHLIKDNPKNILILQAYDPHEGKDNERRLTGTSETSSIHDFSAGVSKCYFQIP